MRTTVRRGARVRCITFFGTTKPFRAQPTASEHLKILQQTGLIRGKRIKQWTFYRRDEARIGRLKNAVLSGI